MKRARLAVMLVAALSSVASAGSYLGLGIGTKPAISDQKDRLETEGRSGKFLLGTRWGNVSAEGAIGGYSVLVSSSDTFIPLGDAYQASAALKMSLPFASGFEGFGRVGVHHTWINSDKDMNSVSGNGFLIGAGFEYRLNLTVTQASLFVDYQYSKAKLEGDRFKDGMAFESSSRMWTLGLTVGI